MILQVSGEAPSNSWYSEVSKHNFDVEPMSTGTGHFTQMVWKASKRMGIAKAIDHNSGKVRSM